jgi:hypothetical protein
MVIVIVMVFLLCSYSYDGGHCHDNVFYVGLCLVMLEFYLLLNLRVFAHVFYKV